MEARELTAYVVWFSSSVNPTTISKCLDGIWTWITSRDGYQVTPQPGITPASGFNPWVRVDQNISLLLVAEYWSAGDICGTLKNSPGFLKSGQQVIAFKIDLRHYIPHQGLDNQSLVANIAAWFGQIGEYHLTKP